MTQIYTDNGFYFQDVLVGMQIIPGRHQPKFGYEAAGIVRRVGPNASKLRVGDRAVVVGINTFSTTLTGPEVYYEKLPDHISFVEGACIPTIFMTAVYGLIDLGHLSKGQVREIPTHAISSGGITDMFK
jgi:NADPH:quinone reductase-like Zn-dependent oxidoreductase